ncbi:MAG: PTS sugar transporter subunit IIA [Candidatus Omnitrophota bacterium]|jgi:PTS system nitrogen regulatory IIA component
MQLKVRDAAKLFKVPESRIYDWLRRRELPAVRVNGQFRLNRDEVILWASEKGIDLSPEVLALPSGDPAPAVTLAETLELGGIYYEVDAHDKMSALASVVSRMPLLKGVNRETLLGVLVAREAIMSTGIGEGLAIPHARNPIVLHVSSPMATLCFLKTPVDYDAVDGRKVDTLFTLITPNVRVHLHLLAKLAFALRSGPFKTAIAAKEKPEVLLGVLRDLEKSS